MYKTKIINFSIGIFAIVILLLMLEGAIRYFRLAPVIFDYKIFEPMEFVENAKVCYKMKPFGPCEGGHLNSDGFKDKEFILRKNKDAIRIVMLGDSITNGMGVPLGETFSDQLEDLLNEKSKHHNNSRPRYEVMNFGVGGYNIVSEIEVLKVYALRYGPDIVVLNYFFNDNDEYSFNYRFFMNKNGVSPLEKNLIYNYYLSSTQFRLNRLLFRSHLYLFCWIRIKSLFKKWEDIKPRDYTTYKEDIVFEKIKEFKELGERYHFKVLIAMHPVLDYDKARPDNNYELTEKIACSLGIPNIDLRVFYQRESADPRVFLQNEKDKVHPNVKGHRFIARVLCEELERRKLVNFK